MVAHRATFFPQMMGNVLKETSILLNPLKNINSEIVIGRTKNDVRCVKDEERLQPKTIPSNKTLKIVFDQKNKFFVIEIKRSYSKILTSIKDFRPLILNCSILIT